MMDQSQLWLTCSMTFLSSGGIASGGSVMSRGEMVTTPLRAVRTSEATSILDLVWYDWRVPGSDRREIDVAARTQACDHP
jgi:hypothetical protein